MSKILITTLPIPNKKKRVRRRNLSRKLTLKGLPVILPLLPVQIIKLAKTTLSNITKKS